MPERVAQRSLREVLVERMEAFRRDHPDEAKVLDGALLEYGTSIPEEEWAKLDNLGDIVVAQIEHRVEEHREEGDEISPEDFIGMLFALASDGKITADRIMERLQTG